MADSRRSARIAVVWDLLSATLSARSSSVGRADLDVVDVGGGTGGFAVPLAESGHRVVVVDPSPDALAALERRAHEAGVSGRVRAVQGDVAALLDSVDPQAADAVLCHEVLEHVDDAAVAVAACRAALRDDGVLSLVVAQRSAAVLARALAGRLDQARHVLADETGRWGDTDPLPRRFDEAGVLAVLRAEGLVVRQVDGIRVVADLVPAALVDAEPGAAADLLALERAIAADPVFRAIATQLHVVAVRA